MTHVSRRHFIQKSALAAGATIALSQLPKELFAGAKLADMPLGFQTWVVKDQIGKDFAGTTKMLSDLGYTLAEMCSPKGYGGGFEPLGKVKPSELKKMFSDAGMKCPSCHFGLKELTDDLDSRIEWSKELGLEHMVCSSFGLGEKGTLKDYLDASDKLNKAGEKIKKAGMQAGFHNHSVEFTSLDGKLIWEEMMKKLDGDLVKMQFQTEVINLGYKASTYFNKYPGRFISAHLSDWTAAKEQAPVGKGVIDWKEFFAAGKAAGVKYYYVEMEPATFKDSAEYIKQL
ncbi:MAG: sugar phosphate isomerase/epimerase [Chitinophagaceae bacterium]|nr:MAG: sugar phosphate isomerase/epimerase [Chitinophagaceae bacterium]